MTSIDRSTRIGPLWAGLHAQPAARVPYRDAQDLAPQDRDLMSRPINLFRALANSPGALRVHHAFGEWIRWDCTLDGRLRELIILLVGYLTHSPYEYSHHIAIARSFDVDSDDVRAITEWANGSTEAFAGEPEVIAALTMTVQIVEPGTVDDEAWTRASALFSEENLTDIVVIASFYCYVVRVLGTVRIEVEPDYAIELDTHPLD
ncbi:carboxymuconolactone decarboxylase family protein [Microbacterium sp. NPDC058342]|uniref:carboxymuconolactone decarboxylase family protein n=1 Tax=Microbacterium sp. NPDC058342 TaxID=3346454 RepID=UPI003659D1F1